MSTPVLTTVSALELFLGLDAGTDTDLLTALALGAEALFVAACGRADAPFADAQSGRVEVRDGSGTRTLWLDYPIAALTSVVVTWVSGCTETLDLASLRWQAGRARLVRSDGGVFGCADAADAIAITYNAAADLPGDDAALAIQRAVATVYRQLGSEDVRSERTGSYQAELAQAITGDPIWALATGNHRRPRL